MKKFMFAFALSALAFAGCSNQDEGQEVAPVNPHAINFRSNTTRASMVDLTAMQADVAGFRVFGVTNTTPTAWYPGVDGTNNYKYVGTTWRWNTGAPQWPTGADYPMNFYAYYAGSYTGLTVASATPAVLTATYTIQPVASQQDLLAAKVVVASKPTTGFAPLVFDHILSKFDFKVIAGNGKSIHLQSLGMNNLGNQRTYDLKTGDWLAPPTAFASSYLYKETTTPATTITGVDPSEAASLPILPSNGSLMLMPQTAVTWTPVSATPPANAYASLIYRISTVLEPNMVGYSLAQSHPNFAALTPTEQTALTGKPLFVKVGFPFAPLTITWVKGMGYTYNIVLGAANASNGYLLDNHFYDENGAPTNLLFGTKVVGDQVSNGRIDFTVAINPWSNQPDATIQ